jgi:uncharacterized SAM-binding protein YcdF (DUF218 family)
MKRFTVGLVAVVVLTLALGAGAFFGVGYYLSPQDPLVHADAIVAISGGDTAARTEEAVKLYQDGWSKHLIFSGAALDAAGPSNAATMAAEAKKAGIPATAITLDEAALDTRGNAAGVSAIASRNQYDSIILVTSPYHQRRANLVFGRALGPSVRIINHSSVDKLWRRSQWWLTPESQALTLSELQKVIYEIVSR